MTCDFEPLSCPMCGGELMYSEGTHDLCCKKNTPELLNTETSRGRIGETTGDRGERGTAMPGDETGPSARALYEPGSAYRSISETADRATGKSEAGATCEFAVSFTESGKRGTLWSIRTVHGSTNYFSLMRLMDKIEKRQRRGEPLASNVPNPPRKVERSKECKLAFRYSLEVEDLYSIKYSSETVNKLAMYYGLTEPDIRHIKSAELGEE